MQLKKEHLEQIGEYVRKQLPEWMGSIPQFSVSANIELRERIVRIEDQREILLRGFEQTDKRFEQTDKQFEQIDKRFEQVDKHFEQIDKRFEQVDKQFELVDKRFEQMDKRFELIQNSMDKRFELLQESFNKQFSQIDKRLSLLSKMMLFGFSMMSAAITAAIALVHFSKV